MMMCDGRSLVIDPEHVLVERDRMGQAQARKLGQGVCLQVCRRKCNGHRTCRQNGSQAFGICEEEEFVMPKSGR